MRRRVLSITLLITLLATSYLNFNIQSYAKDYSKYYFTDFESNLVDNKFIEIKNDDDLDEAYDYELNWLNSDLVSFMDERIEDISENLALMQRVYTSDVVVRKHKYPHMLQFVVPNDISNIEIQDILSKYDTTLLFGYRFSDEYRETKFNEFLARWEFADGSPLTYDFLRKHFEGPEKEFNYLADYINTRSFLENEREYTERGLFQDLYFSGIKNIINHKESRYYVRFKTEGELKSAKEELLAYGDIAIERYNINEIIPIEENAIVVSYTHHASSKELYPENNTEVMEQLKELLKEYNLKITDSDVINMGESHNFCQNLIIENIKPDQFYEVFNLVESFLDSIKTHKSLYYLHITTNDCVLLLNKEEKTADGGYYLSSTNPRYQIPGEYFRVDNVKTQDITADFKFKRFIDAVVKYGDDAYIYALQTEWGPTRVFRAYNPNTGEHLFTSNEKEYNNLATKGWKKEGVAFSSVEKIGGKKSEVYRVYNPNAKGGDHHYTKSKKEAEKLVKKGWKMDNKGKPVFYGNGSKEVYRLYNKNDGRHHYTSKKTERNKLVKLGWKDEGIGWSAVE